MQGRLSVLAAGLALALGGGVAGAALISNGVGEEPPPPTAELAAERSAAESQKVAYAKLHHALKTAQKARRIARRARNKANQSLATTTALLDDVDKALADSADALLAAEDAEADASTALAKVNSTQIVSDTAPGSATAVASDPDYQAAPDGPRVTVTVPPSGLIEVWASAQIESDEGAVGLFEDGNLVVIQGQQEACGVDDALFTFNDPGGFPTPVTVSTPIDFDVLGICGTLGDAPAPMLFQRPPGEHTYELRYADCGCDGDDAVFSRRTLRVAPRL